MTANVTFTVVVHIDVQAHLSSHSTEVKLDGWFELQTHSSMVRNTSIASSRKPHLIDGFYPSLKSNGCERERERSHCTSNVQVTEEAKEYQTRIDQGRNLLGTRRKLQSFWR